MMERESCVISIVLQRLFRVCSHFDRIRVAWQMVPGKTRDAGKGVPLVKSRNAAWGHLPNNPSGRVSFCAGRRHSSFICSKQISLLVPCPTQKLLPARLWPKRK